MKNRPRGDDSDFDNRRNFEQYQEDDLITPKRSKERRPRSTKRRVEGQRATVVKRRSKSTIRKHDKGKFSSPQKSVNLDVKIPQRSFNPKEEHPMYPFPENDEIEDFENELLGQNKKSLGSIEDIYQDDPENNPFRNSQNFGSEKKPLSIQDYENYMFDSMEDLLIEMVDTLLKTKGTIRNTKIFF